MELHCTQNHLMAKGAKFCGECGSGPATPEEQGKCAACESTMAKSAKFCAACGTAAATTVEDLDAVLDELGTFAKANAAIVDDMGKLPEIDEEMVDVGEIDAMLKSATVKDEATGVEGIDAVPVVAELLRQQNIEAATEHVHAEHIIKALTHIARGQGLIAKTQLAIGARLKEFEVAGNAPRGRKASLALVTKALPGTGAGAAPAGAVANGLRGKDLFAKAKMGSLKFAKANDGPELLSMIEEGALTDYLTRQDQERPDGWSMEDLAQVDPGLAHKVGQCIAIMQDGAAA